MKFLAHAGSSPLFMQNPFRAELAPTKAVIDRGAYSPELYASLIGGVPDSDGVGGVPLPIASQAVYLTMFSATHLAVLGAVEFGSFASLQPRTLVLTNGAGEREAYGVIRSARAGPQPSPTIHLPSHRILVRRIPRPLGLGPRTRNPMTPFDPFETLEN
ncbi:MULTISPECIES: hypothetical protein [Brevundimonas]|uniref:hypothetical protein n=1 Tax=Brevundimonas TaxID=41275 RepID=UPI00174D526F|nr:hypothetical protein [Brevundimonas aurantiaca]